MSSRPEPQGAQATEAKWRDPDKASPAMPAVRRSLHSVGMLFFPSSSMRDGFHYKFWVYILFSRSGTLYVGLTRFFERRIHQHKYNTIEGFTQKYQCHRLVYYESYQDVTLAIAREKQLKRWRREKKIALVKKINPRWQDLAENWGREMRFRAQSLVKMP